MKIVSLSQGSEEWHKWRKGGVGASDVATIMGNNPWKTRLQLWEEKCGFRTSEVDNKFTRHGKEMEPRVLRLVNDLYSLQAKPLCVEDMEVSEYRASLDGWDSDTKTLIEIKAPHSEEVIERARNTRSLPNYYFDQVQWQIKICRPARALLVIWDWRREEIVPVEVVPIADYILRLEENVRDFWFSVKSGKQPEGCERDYRVLEGEELREKLEAYQELAITERECQKKKEELRIELTEIGEGTNFRAYGYTVTMQRPKSHFDHDRMRADGIDLEKYLKPPVGKNYWRVNCPRLKKSSPSSKR